MWKLHTRDESVSPAMTSSSEHDTEEAALDAACVAPRTAHLKVLYIEGPNDELITLTQIKVWCRRRR